MSDASAVEESERKYREREEGFLISLIQAGAVWHGPSSLSIMAGEVKANARAAKYEFRGAGEGEESQAGSVHTKVRSAMANRLCDGRMVCTWIW